MAWSNPNFPISQFPNWFLVPKWLDKKDLGGHSVSIILVCSSSQSVNPMQRKEWISLNSAKVHGCSTRSRHVLAAEFQIHRPLERLKMLKGGIRLEVVAMNLQNVSRCQCMGIHGTKHWASLKSIRFPYSSRELSSPQF